MLYQPANEVKELMNKLDALRGEYVEASMISLDDHGLEGLSKKGLEQGYHLE